MDVVTITSVPAAIRIDVVMDASTRSPCHHRRGDDRQQAVSTMRTSDASEVAAQFSRDQEQRT